MIGSIPQQDVFQRVMSAKSADIAVQGPIIGGISYTLFALVPMFIGVSAFLIMSCRCSSSRITRRWRAAPTSTSRATWPSR